MKAVTWLSGTAPIKPSAGWPLMKAITAGIDWIPICWATAGWWSIFILTSLTLPLAARTAFSMIGVNWRQGPHHGAQKSISTGWRFDSSMTSFTKVWVVVSLIRSAAACGVGPLPCSIIVTESSSAVLVAPVLARPNGGSEVLFLSGGLPGNFNWLPGRAARLPARGSTAGYRFPGDPCQLRPPEPVWIGFENRSKPPRLRLPAA